MSNYNWLTPEEMIKKKARNKKIIYAAFLLATALLSAAVTVLANQI